MMKPTEENDPHWQLLLKSKRQAPSDLFVRNVVREARKLGVDGQRGGWATFADWFKRPLVAAPLATGALAVLIAALTFLQNPTPSPPHVDLTLARTAGDSTPTPAGGPAYDLAETIPENLKRIDYLGELVSVSDPGELDDADLAELLALR